MTPAQHTTAAGNLLAATAAKGDVRTLTRNAQLAEVHATLGFATGSGADYASAEVALSTAESPNGNDTDLCRAAAFAQLAPKA